MFLSFLKKSSVAAKIVLENFTFHSQCSKILKSVLWSITFFKEQTNKKTIGAAFHTWNALGLKKYQC